MIDPKKDLFARLTISARKFSKKSHFKELKKTFPHADNQNIVAAKNNNGSSTSPNTNKNISQKPAVLQNTKNILQKQIAKPANSSNVIQLAAEKPSPSDKPSIPFPNNLKPMKIEERIRNIASNPELKALRFELANLENLFHSIKQKEQNKELIARLESKIHDIKKLIDQKTYI